MTKLIFRLVEIASEILVYFRLTIVGARKLMCGTSGLLKILSNQVKVFVKTLNGLHGIVLKLLYLRLANNIMTVCLVMHHHYAIVYFKKFAGLVCHVYHSLIIRHDLGLLLLKRCAWSATLILG